MKKGIILIILAAVLIGCVSCEKTKDYRHKWVGTYECEERYGVGSGTSGENIYQTKVKVTMVGDSSLSFLENRNGDYYEAIVNNKGEFLKSGSIRGYLTKDSLYLDIYRRYPGYSYSLTYKGKKIKM